MDDDFDIDLSPMTFHIQCLLSESECDWIGKESDLINHFQAKHQDRILTENADSILHLNYSYSISNVIICDKILFFIVWKFSKNKRKLECKVTSHKDNYRSENTSCRGSLTIEFLEKAFSFDFDADVMFCKTVPYLELFNTITKISSLKASFTFQNVPKKSTQYKTSIRVPPSPPSNSFSLEDPNYEYGQASNSSLNVYTHNPTIEAANNYCDLNKIGCNIRDTIETFIYQHQQACHYELVLCSIFSGRQRCGAIVCLKHTQFHILHNHKRHIISNGTETIFPALKNYMSFNSIFVSVGNYLFSFVMKLMGNRVYRCVVQTLSPEAPECYFTIEIRNKTELLKGNLMRRQNCMVYGDINDSTPNTFCCFIESELLPYCFQDDINKRNSFYIRITIYKS